MTLSRNTKVLSFASFLVDTSTEMMNFLIPFFMINVLGGSVLLVGLMEGLDALVVGAMAIASGILSARLGRVKWPIVAGYSISAFFKGLLIFAVSPLQVLFIRIFERLGKGVRETPRDALIAMSEPPANFGRAFGFRKLLDNLGAIAGPFIASVLIMLYFNNSHSADSYRFIFSLGLIPAVIAVVFLIALIRDTPSRPVKTSIASMKAILRSPKAKGFVSVCLLLALANFSSYFFLIRAGEVMDLVMVGWSYFVYNFFYAIFSYPAGFLSDRFGPKRAMAAGAALFLCALAGFAFLSSSIAIMAMFGLLGMFMSFLQTVPHAFITSTVPKEETPAAVGAYRGAVGLIGLPANLFAAFLWGTSVFSVHASFLFSLVTAGLAFVLLLLMKKD